MFFFGFEAVVPDSGRITTDTRDALQNHTQGIFIKNKKQLFIFVSSISNHKLAGGALLKVSGNYNTKKLYQQITDYLETVGIAAEELTVFEVTMRDLLSKLRSACRHSFIYDDIEITEIFKLDEVVHVFTRLNYLGISIWERLVQDEKNKSVLKKEAAELFCGEELGLELDRIFCNKASALVMGHPVHYLLQAYDTDMHEKMADILLAALYKCRRLKTRRYFMLHIVPDNELSEEMLEQLYASSDNGAIMVSFQCTGEIGSGFAVHSMDNIKILCGVMKKYRHRVLTLFCLLGEDEKTKRGIIENIGNCSLVEIRETFLAGERAREYLYSMAKAYHVTATQSLLDYIADEEKGYSASELTDFFNLWFDDCLKTDFYPQYQGAAMVNELSTLNKSLDSAYQELQELIGLEEAKKIIGQILDYHKICKMYCESGLFQESPAIHMVFTGNPGTAKTTVARLFARILQENGVLRRGELYEVGRADLVGKYVGWTAQMVKQKFREAKGSVLFIDEAYSLSVDECGSYGEEAINTIVQEMENYRNELCVIFAGYPREMKEFLRRNPGLYSRIAFHVPFQDYTVDELFEIMKLLAKKRSLVLGEDLKEKLFPIFAEAKKHPDFGNGRFVRNMLEQAVMRRASRLLKNDSSCITKEKLVRLADEDFIYTPAIIGPERPEIGFRVQ